MGAPLRNENRQKHLYRSHYFRLEISLIQGDLLTGVKLEQGGTIRIEKSLMMI